MIGATLDSKQVLTNLSNVQQTLLDTDPLSQLIGNEVLRLSQMDVPHDEGTLQNSGTVETIDGDVTVGYHTPYAARLHEHPEYHFQAGRKGKYLEDPIIRNESALGIQLVQKLESDIQGDTNG